MAWQRFNCNADDSILLQGIFPTEGSNPGLLHCKQILYRLSHQGSPGAQEEHLKCLSSPACTSVPDTSSLDLEVPVRAPGQKGAAPPAPHLKEEVWLPCPDRKSMGSHVICGAWLSQAEMDGQGQTGL